MKTFLRVAGACAPVAWAWNPAGPVRDAVLARSQVAYAAQSYATTGTVDTAMVRPRAKAARDHTFKTAYRAPRHFLFDFVREQNADRFVVWVNDEAFHTAGDRCRRHALKGEGGGAFAGGEPTNALMQIHRGCPRRWT